MKKFFKIGALTLLICSVMSGCAHYDDFAFTGQVVGYTFCTSMTDIRDAGYYVKVTSPEGIGGTITSDEGYKMENVVIVYQSGKILTDRCKISGTMFMSDNYSKANCSFHQTEWDLPEAVFTKVDIIDTPDEVK